MLAPNRTLHAVSFLLVCLMALPVSGDTYTNSTDFFNALSAMGATANTFDFENVVADYQINEGDTLNDVGFMSFSSFSPNLDHLVVDDTYTTTSGNNYLGGPVLADYGALFIGGDAFGMGFEASIAIGMNIISAESTNVTLFDDDVWLTAGGESAYLSVGASEADLSDGSKVYFVGVIANAGSFTSAHLGSFDELYYYNIDDITTAQPPSVPEPANAIVWLTGGACISSLYLNRRIRKRGTAVL